VNLVRDIRHLSGSPATAVAALTAAGVTWGPFDRAHLEFAAPDYYCDTPAELLQLLGI